MKQSKNTKKQERNTMISVGEALQQIHRHTPPPQISRLRLPDARGKVLAEDLLAPMDSPPFPNSAMDGFAVRWADVQPAREDRPVELHVVGESEAGHPFEGEIRSGEAVRINTGALIPGGADTVVPVEACRLEGTAVRILEVKQKGQHIRWQGEEFKQGSTLLSRGTLLEAPQLALLASCGIKEVTVYASPAVSIVVTGRELVSFDQERAPHQIHDSNSIMLQAAVQFSGGRVSMLQRVSDNLEQTVQAIESAAKAGEIILISGGVSVGPHDHVKPAAERAGFRTVFWKVNQKPGKPFFFAVNGKKLLFGLPGNPVSAFMGYAVYVHPLITRLCGKESAWPTARLPLKSDYRNKSSRTQLLRIAILPERAEAPRVVLLTQQGSHMISSIARADGFIIVPPERALRSGEFVQVHLFPWRIDHGLHRSDLHQ